MLNVLLVDDEPLVRAGIYHSIPWADYDMQVVDQASNVMEAISKIQSIKRIDVVFTDIIMPEQNGLELLRWLHDNQPAITPVVLSYHNEFSYIQEALRLGTVDYIIKTELHHEKFRQTMENISVKTKRRWQQYQKYDNLQDSKYISAVAICSLNPKPLSIQQCNLLEADCHYPINQNSWLLLYPYTLDEQKLSELEQTYSDECVILSIEQVDTSVADLMQAVNIYFARDFFYERLPHLQVYSLVPNNILNYTGKLTGPEYVQLEEELSTIRWIWDEDRLDYLLNRIYDGRLSPSSVYNLFYCVQTQWRRFFPKNEIPAMFPLTDMNYWYQWLDWISNFRTFATTQSKLNNYSPEIVAAIQGLLPWIDENFMEDISLTKAAQRANLSTSYLSRSFRDFTGLTYSHYIRNTRINYAKKMLSHSDLPVRRIAELCGFQDPFYFDKVFKKSVGISPSNYRQKHSIRKSQNTEKA